MKTIMYLLAVFEVRVKTCENKNSKKAQQDDKNLTCPVTLVIF